MNEAIKILIVDDEELLRSNMRAFFEDLGYQVVEAANGREGLEVLAAEHPHIVFTDLRMPVMDGLTFITTLRESDTELPVIVISGTGTLGDAIEAIRRGAWDYVTKPLQQMECLSITIQRALERARLIAENNAYREHLEDMVRQRTEELQDSESRFRTLFESANDAIILLQDERIVTCNQKTLEMFGCSRQDILDCTLLALSPVRQPDGTPSADKIRELVQAALTWKPQCYEWQHVRPNGEPFEAEISLNRMDLHGDVYLQGIVRDITKHKQYEQRLYEQANYDSLTGLPNRYLLAELITAALKKASAEQSSLYLLLMGVDNFKHINDTLGHFQGDRLLKQLAERLRMQTREGDTAARFVGDEFVVLLTGQRSVEDAALFARATQGKLAAPYPLGHTELFVTVSIGLVDYQAEGESAESMLSNAEAAMFQAKKEGSGHILFFTQEIDEQANERFSLGTRLHKALERDEFALHYQPQIELASRQMVSMEALLRWQPAGGRIVSPDLFVPILEETGLIVPVGEWVLRRACSQLREWLDAGLAPLPVSVNISAWQFHGGRLPETVRLALEESRLDPALLCLELTESIVMRDIDETIQTLQILNEMGVSLSIDDFGTGYSSLSYLRKMPIHELKIDRSFVMNVPHDANSVAIVSTILGMAASLNLWVVAEGVETEDQHRFLHGQNCLKGQGYLFSRPLPAEALPAFARLWVRGRATKAEESPTLPEGELKRKDSFKHKRVIITS